MKKGLFTYSISSALFDMGQNLIRSFGIVFFYIISGNNIYVALGAYVISTAINLIALYLCSYFIGKIGTKVSLLISRLLFLLSALPLIFLTESNYPLIIIIWAIFFGTAKAFYYVPLHVMLLHMTRDVKRGSSIGLLFMISSIIGIFSPFIAGILSSNYSNLGYGLLLTSIFLLSIILLKGIPNLKFNYTGRLRDSLNLSNIKREAKYSILYQIQSQEGFWNIHIFNILNNSFLQFGLITTFVNMIGALLNILLGKWLDGHNRMQTLKINGFLQGSGWLLRSLVNSPSGIVVSDSYMKLTTQAVGETLTVVTYDLISSKGNEVLIDEKIIAREILLISSWIIITLIAMILFYYFGMGAVFLLAIIGCLGIVLL